jgi:hypothetical protein
VGLNFYTRLSQLFEKIFSRLSRLSQLLAPKWSPGPADTTKKVTKKLQKVTKNHNRYENTDTPTSIPGGPARFRRALARIAICYIVPPLAARGAAFRAVLV